MPDGVWGYSTEEDFDRASKAIRFAETFMRGDIDPRIPHRHRRLPNEVTVVVKSLETIDDYQYGKGKFTYWDGEANEWVELDIECYAYGLNDETLEVGKRYHGRTVGDLEYLALVEVTVGGEGSGSGGVWLRITGPISGGSYPATERVWDGSAFIDGDEVVVFAKSGTVLLPFSDNADEYIGVLRSGTSDPKQYDAYGHRTDTFTYPLTYTGTIDPETCTVTLSVDTTQEVTIKALGLEIG